jgi:cytoskeletal protein RodZ
MSQEQPKENEAIQVRPDLRSKPQRRSRRRLPVLLLLLGGLIVIGGGGVLLWQLLAQSPRNGSPVVVAQTVTVAAKDTTSLKDCSHGFPPSYNATLKQQFAQGVHLAVDQVTTAIHSGKPIQNLAAEQGISSDQLFTLELHAYQIADNSMVTYGCMNQYSADLDVKRYRDAGPANLNYDFTFLFTH